MSWKNHKVFDGPRLRCLSDGFNNENMFLEYACWSLMNSRFGGWPYVSRKPSNNGGFGMNPYKNKFWVI